MSREKKKQETIHLVSKRFLVRILVAIGLVTGLYLVSIVLTGANPIRLIQGIPIIIEMIREDLFPPDWDYLERSLSALVETWNIALLATTLAAVLALPLSFLASRNLNPIQSMYRGVRSFLNVMRTIPDIILAILVVAFAGTGVVSGLIALTIFSSVALAKLLSETIEGLRKESFSALEASGSTRLQIIRYAVWPQIFPQYLSYLFYILELNVKTSVILGFIGAGGIGQLIDRNVQFFRYSRLTLVLLVLIVVISLIDGVSNGIRKVIE